MSSSSRLSRPGSAGIKSPSLRKEVQGNRSCMLRIGERLMRAGSEGNLVQRQVSVQNQSQTCSSGLRQRPNGQTQTAASSAHAGKHSKDLENTLSTVSTTEHVLQKRLHTDSSPPWNSHSSAPHSPSPLPGRHPGPSSKEHEFDDLRGQHYGAERKDVFLEQLRHKYPQHTATITDHQERMREQARKPQPPESPHRTGVLDLAQQESVTMSKGEGLPTGEPFTRGCKARASLPVSRSSSHSKERSKGVLYLQYGEETKQVYMSSEIMSQDTLRAMFISAFPQQLTMKMLQSPNMTIYIKDTSRNSYYGLEDVRNIAPHSCLKVYHKDPAHVFSRHSGPTNTEGRISKERLYGSYSPLHTLSSSSRGPLHNLQGSMSPPMVRSMPSSPSRMAYGGGGSHGGTGVADPGSATFPRECLSGRSTSLSSSSSSILERRDVKPDEDVSSSKSMALVVHGDGAHHTDSYSSIWDEVSHLSIASSQCSAPPTLTADLVDSGISGIPGGLQQYRASVKPLMTYEQKNCSPHRQKNRNYGDSQYPLLGSKSSAVRIADAQIIRGVGPVSPERMAQIRRPLWQDSNGTTTEIRNRNRSRGSGSSSSMSSVFMDSPLPQLETPFQGSVTPADAQSERMKAMEAQIASLAGLVHHALSMGADAGGLKDTVRENGEYKITNNTSGSAATINSCSPAPMAVAGRRCDNRLQHKLTSAKKSVSDLRMQLNNLRHLQMSNQEAVNSMLRVAGEELLMVMCQHLAQSEEAAFRHRAEMEEEKMQYLATEEKILTQLSKLEEYVAHLQSSRCSVTLRDVEEGAVSLRNVGESLAILKSEFPELQVKMCSVLRLEVEAIRFLKDEPQKMDSMLKRVKALTEDLSALRRCMSESFPSTRPVHAEPVKVQDTDPLKTHSPRSSPKPQPRSSFRPPLTAPEVELGFAGSTSPVKAHRVKTTTATVVHTPPHNPLLTSTHGPDSVAVVKTTERQTAEGAVSADPSTVVQPSSTSPPPNTTITECDQVLQETQHDPPAPKAEHDTPHNLTIQAPAEQQSAVSDTGEHTAPTQSDEVDSHHIKPSDAATALSSSSSSLSSSSSSSAAAASVAGSTEQSSRVDKPSRSTVNTDLKQSPERASKSPPPPPPPRRFHGGSGSGSGLATGRSEEVVNSRKDFLRVQNKHEKELPVTPQPKPPRQPPEVKAKPQNTAALLPRPTSSSTPSTTDREDKEEDEEEDEDNKFMKELQVTVDTSHESLFVGKIKGVGSSSSKPQVVIQKPLEHKFVPSSAIGVMKSTTVECKVHCDAREDTVDPDSNEVVFLNCVPAVKLEVPAPALQDDHIVNEGNEALKPTDVAVSPSQDVKAPPANTVSPNQMDMSSPTVVDTEKVKYAAIVTLQKEYKQTHGDKTNEKAVNQSPGGKKSNLTVVVSEQKANGTEDYSAGTQAKSPGTFKNVSSPPTIKPHLIYNHSSKQEIQNTPVRGSTDLILYTDEDGCSLSPENCNDEGPPPPPPPPTKIRLLKTKPRTQSKEENLNKMNNSEIQSEDGDAISVDYEKYGFEDHNDFTNGPVIVFLNEPMDIHTAYKRLSTIFEYEEDQIVVDEEGLEQQEGEQELEMADIVQTDNGPMCDKQEQNKPDSLRKTDTKRKFKFTFSKNKLAQISQAIRSGTTKTEKKTLEIVVREEEQVITSDIKPRRETKKQYKEIKRFGINSSKGQEAELSKVNTRNKDISSPRLSKTSSKNLCTFGDNVQESIKQLEISVDGITSSLSSSSIGSHDPSSESSDRAQLQDNVKREREQSPSKRPGPQIVKDPTLPQSKRAKAQPLYAKTKTSTKKQTSSSSSGSPAQRSQAKLRHSSTSGSTKNPPSTSQQQTTKKQSSQANSRDTRAGGDTNDSATPSRASKIPALCHSSGKQPYASLSTSLCSDTNLSTSSSSSSSSSSSPSSLGKHFHSPKCPPPSPPSSKQAVLCSLSPSPLVKNSPPSESPPSSPLLSSSLLHKSLIPSLNLSRLLTSSSLVSSPSHASSTPAAPAPHGPHNNSSKHQHCLAFTSSYSSSSSSSPPSSSTSSSLSPTSSSSSPSSPSSSLLPTMVSHGAKSVRTPVSSLRSPSHSKKQNSVGKVGGVMHEPVSGTGFKDTTAQTRS